MMEETVIDLTSGLTETEARSKSNTKRIDESSFRLNATESKVAELDHVLNTNGVRKNMSEMKAKMDDLRSTVHTGFAELKQELHDFKENREETCPVSKHQVDIKQNIDKEREHINIKRERRNRAIEIVCIVLALIPIYIGLFR